MRHTANRLVEMALLKRADHKVMERDGHDERTQDSSG